MARPSITLFTLGGTIAMAPGESGGAVPALSGDALVEAVPEIGEIADLHVVPVAQTGSANLTIGQMLDLARQITSAAESGTDGVVVTQGTDTMAESAFLLALTLRLEIPVIVTGAMRHAGLPSPDGPGNLLTAVQVAAHPEMAATGPLVAMGGTLHAARFVAKRHTVRADAFASPGAGPVAEMAEGTLRRLAQPAPPPHIPLADIGNVPEVALIPAAFGDSGHLLGGLPDSLTGIVIAAFGGGHLPEAMADRAAALAARMPVVLASNTGAGPVLERSYGYPGAEIDLIVRGLIPAGLYSPEKARLILSLMLAAGAERGDIAKALAS